MDYNRPDRSGDFRKIFETKTLNYLAHLVLIFSNDIQSLVFITMRKMRSKCISASYYVYKLVTFLPCSSSLITFILLPISTDEKLAMDFIHSIEVPLLNANLSTPNFFRKKRGHCLGSILCTTRY